MATKAEERRNTIRGFLQTNPGAHAAEAIAESCGFTAADTRRALGQLAKHGAVAETDPGELGTGGWTATAAAEPQPDDSTTAAVDESTGPDATADETGTDADNAEPEATVEAPEPDSESDPAAPGEATEPGENGAGGDDTGSRSEGEPTDAAGAGPDERGGDASTGGTDNGDEPAEVQDSGEAGSATAEDGQGDADPVPDPDPAVLLLAGQLAELDGPVGLEAITLAAFKVAGARQTETALHALCALAEHGALECSEPYSPDDRDREDKVAWTVTVEPDELDRIAAITQLADAPHAAVCPTCNSEIALPHPKGVGRSKSAANERKDRKRRLADGELRDMILTLVKENPGEELKPADFVRELKNDPRFQDRISPNPSGAVRSALVKLAEDRVWVSEIEGRQPLTYRCHEAP